MVKEVREHNEYLIERIITFLKENEEYGDNWTNEINELERLLEV